MKKDAPNEAKNKNLADKDLLELDAASLFNKALEEIEAEERQITEELNSEERRDSRQETVKFYETVLLAFQKAAANPDESLALCSKVAAALKKSMLDKDVDVTDGAVIFGNVCFRIERDEERFINTDSVNMRKFVMTNIYRSLFSNAVKFCVESLDKQINENDLPKWLVLLTDWKKRILEDKFSFRFDTNQLNFAENFMVEAATQKIDEIERKIQMKADEIEIIKRLETKKQSETEAGLPLPNEENQAADAVKTQNDFYSRAKSVRQKVLFYLITKHGTLHKPDGITRAQLARNIAEVTGGNVCTITTTLQKRLIPKENSVKAAESIATDLRAVLEGLKKIKIKDESRKQRIFNIIKDEIKRHIQNQKTTKNSY